MSWAAVPDFADRWYAPSQVTVQTLTWRHWPALAQLLADDFGHGLQAFGLRAFGPFDFEEPGLALLHTPKPRRWSSNAAGRAVALACLSPDRRWPTVSNLDLIGHPAWSDQWPRLLSALDLPREGAVLAAGEAEARLAAVESRGFKLEATLSRQRPDGGDVLVLALDS